MRLISIIKAPGETLIHTVDLGGRGSGPVIVNIQSRGLVAGATALNVVNLIVAGDLELRIGAGSDGEVYTIDANVTLNDGQVIEAPIEVAVIDGTWAMPDGGAPMLSVTDFVSRVGRDQVLRLTDLGDGRIDKGLVIGALTDAQAQAEAYLAGRYSLPFAQVPPMIEAIIADLARAALYENEVPENVAEKRKIAIRNLEGFRDGKLRLGSEVAAETKQSSNPVRFNSGERAYPDGLRDYTFR